MRFMLIIVASFIIGNFTAYLLDAKPPKKDCTYELSAEFIGPVSPECQKDEVPHPVLHP